MGGRDGESECGGWFSLFFADDTGSVSALSFRMLFNDRGLVRSVVKLVDDLDFFGFDSFSSLAFFSGSLPESDFSEMALKVFLCRDLKPSPPSLLRPLSLCFFSLSGAFLSASLCFLSASLSFCLLSTSLDFVGDNGTAYFC